MNNISLRPYQIQAIEEIRYHTRRGRKRILLVAPTGSGKTVIAAEMIRSADAKGSAKLFLAHRKELITQCSQKLTDCGVDHGIIRGSDPRRKPWLSTHVCSVPTLARRTNLPRAEILFIDECHHAAAATYRNIIDRYPNAAVIGLTATPIRDSGRGLGDLFEEMVQCPSMAELTTMGFLVPTLVFAPSRPDLSGVHTTGGDYVNDELAHVMDRPALIGDAVEHWKRLCSDRLSVCFAVNIAHSKHIVEQFVAAGIRAEHLDGDMPEAVRDGVLQRLRCGETRLVSNCMVLTEGWDFPDASAALLCRPTQSLGLWLQMVGRILRPTAGKRDAVILDHAGSTYRHGLPDYPRDWQLEYPKQKRHTKDAETGVSVRMCPQCWAAFSPTVIVCPHCGWQYVPKTRLPETREGELVEITGASIPGKDFMGKKLSSDPEIAQLQRHAWQNGYKPAWLWFETKRLWERRARHRGNPQRRAPEVFREGLAP